MTKSTRGPLVLQTTAKQRTVTVKEPIPVSLHSTEPNKDRMKAYRGWRWRYDNHDSNWHHEPVPIDPMRAEEIVAGRK